MNLLSLLFPPRCIFCRRVLSDHAPGVCSACQKRILLNVNPPHKAKGAFYKCVYSALWYEGAVRKCLHRYKFSGKSNYAPTLAKILQHALPQDQTFDIITFVPTNPQNIKQRGYHHTGLLAQELSALTGIPCKELLMKTRKTSPMHGLHVAQRRANILGAIAVSAPIDAIMGKRILVVDDLITTGSTMSECARALMERGAAGVWGATLAERKKISKNSQQRY